MNNIAGQDGCMQSPTKHFDERELIVAQRICSVSVVHRPASSPQEWCPSGAEIWVSEMM
jgi:hypothetical protein